MCNNKKKSCVKECSQERRMVKKEQSLDEQQADVEICGETWTPTPGKKIGHKRILVISCWESQILKLLKLQFAHINILCINATIIYFIFNSEYWTRFFSNYTFIVINRHIIIWRWCCRRNSKLHIEFAWEVLV